MADNKVINLLKNGTVVSDSKGEVLDLLHYSRLQVEVKVKVASNASQTIQLQHAAVNEAEAFEDLGPTYALDSVGNVVNSYSSFLRYVRMVASSSISTQPILSVGVIAKQYKRPDQQSSRRQARL